jgi:hypothetical protein
LRTLRLKIASLLVLIVGIGLDLAAIRAWFIYRTNGRVIFNNIEVLGLGALPVANALAIGLIGWRIRPRWRPFLAGFIAFGMLALTVYIGLVYWSTESVIMPLLLSILRPVSRAIRYANPIWRTGAFYTITVVMLITPLLLAAVIGGVVTHKYLERVRRSAHREGAAVGTVAT